MSRFEQPSPLKNRSSRKLYDTYHYNGRKRTFEQPPNPQDVRVATSTSYSTTPTQLYTCANCNDDHRATECDSLKCFTCQATFPTAALRQAHYMSTQRCDSANKRTRFAPITTPARSQYTPPSSLFLSRSAAEMQNPSPYDSGYDSNFSSASGPGQPPSSRGSSDIDDQVEHYIRDQRVATIASTLPFTPSQDTPTQPISHPRHFNQHQLNIVRAIAEHHLAIANYPEHEHPPPLIPDSDTEDEVDTDDTTSVPPLIRLDAQRHSR